MQLEKRLAAMERRKMSPAVQAIEAEAFMRRLKDCGDRLGKMPTSDEWYRKASPFEITAVVVHLLRSPVPQALVDRFAEIAEQESLVGELFRRLKSKAQELG